MRPERPTMSQSCSIATSRIRSAGTITPRSMTSYPLQPRTTPTMFLPMSCTSPLTVASTIRAADSRLVLSASMYGSRYETARFIARALLTTCGRNIFPAPKRSPTIFMPSMSGPSMTSSGRAAAWRASSVSSSMKSTTPCTRAWASRSPTGASRHERSSSRCIAPPVTVLAYSTSRSVASGRRSKRTSSTRSSSSGSMSA